MGKMVVLGVVQREEAQQSEVETHHPQVHHKETTVVVALQVLTPAEEGVVLALRVETILRRLVG
jgi:pterin-4a-carbinolamine dehydratase